MPKLDSIGFTPPPSFTYSHTAVGSESFEKDQNDQNVLHHTEKCGAIIARQGETLASKGSSDLGNQELSTRNLSSNPNLEFKSVLGKGREKRKEIVRKFFNDVLSKIYGSQESALSKIERDPSDRTCRLLYDGETAVGVVVYKKNTTNKVFADSLKIKKLEVLEAAHVGKGYRSTLLNKVEDAAAQLQAKSIHITVNSSCLDAIAFYKRNGFVENPVLTLLEDNETNNVLLMKKLAVTHLSAENHSSKRLKINDESSVKHKSEHEQEATRANDRTPDAKTSTKRPHSSDEPRSAEPAVRTPYPQKNFAQRTQYVARRSFSSDQRQPPRMLEATLKKIYVHMIKQGTKTIEGRINSGMFSNLRVGQLARFFYSGRDSGEVTCEITKVNKYESFEEMLTTEGYKPCLPDAHSLENAVNTYHSIPSFTERAKRSGVVAIHLKKISEK